MPLPGSQLFELSGGSNAHGFSKTSTVAAEQGLQEVLAAMLQPQPCHRIPLAQLKRNSWVVSGLPPAAATMTQRFVSNGRACNQPAEEIKAAVLAAAAAPGQLKPAATASAAGSGPAAASPPAALLCSRARAASRSVAWPCCPGTVVQAAAPVACTPAGIPPAQRQCSRHIAAQQCQQVHRVACGTAGSELRQQRTPVHGRGCVCPAICTAVTCELAQASSKQLAGYCSAPAVFLQ